MAAGDDPGDPRDRVPNANDPIGSVGPNVPAGFGDTHVMYPAGYPPAQAEAWQGWPVEWATPYLEPTPAYSTFFGFGASDPSGYLRRVSTVGSCVAINARQLASFPAYGVKDRVPVELPDWYRVSPEPQVYGSWSEFIKAAVTSYQLHGETVLYATAFFADGYPRRFVCLNPNSVTVDADGRHHLIADDGGTVDLGYKAPMPGASVCRITYLLPPGGRPDARGIGPLEWAGRHLVSADVLDRYAMNIAAHGVTAVLTAPGRLTDSQVDEARGRWMYARRANPGAPAILTDGMSYEALSLSPRDMALLDLKVFDLQMIAVAFGVPPGLVGLPAVSGNLEYSSPSMLGDGHWRQTLRPMAGTFADALSNWLLPRGTALEFNPDRYVQPGLGERATAWATLHGIEDPDGSQAITVDEIRVAERFAPYAAPPANSESVAGLIGSTAA